MIKKKLDLGDFDLSNEDIDEETGNFKGDNDKIKMENIKDYEVMLIRPNNIKGIAIFIDEFDPVSPINPE